MPFGACHAHVQEATALAALLRVAREVGREGVVVHVHVDDALKLEPLGAVVGGEGNHVLPLRRRLFAPEREVREQVRQRLASERAGGVGGEEGRQAAGKAGLEAGRGREQCLLIDQRVERVLAQAVRQGAGQERAQVVPGGGGVAQGPRVAHL